MAAAILEATFEHSFSCKSSSGQRKIYGSYITSRCESNKKARSRKAHQSRPSCFHEKCMTLRMQLLCLCAKDLATCTHRNNSAPDTSHQPQSTLEVADATYVAPPSFKPQYRDYGGPTSSIPTLKGETTQELWSRERMRCQLDHSSRRFHPFQQRFPIHDLDNRGFWCLGLDCGELEL